MKTYLFFFITFTLAEILFSFIYYTLVQKIDAILILGAALYLTTIITVYIGIRITLYQEKRKALIDSLLKTT